MLESDEAEANVFSDKIIGAIKFKDLDLNKLQSFIKDYFNKDISFIMKYLGLDASEGSGVDCEDNEECLKVDALTKLMYKMTYGSENRRQRLGSFLRSFIPLILDNFNDGKKISLICFFMGCKKDLCKTLNEKESFLHSIFTNVSAKVGIKKEISAFDIPSLLSYNLDLWQTDEPSFFKNYRCQEGKKVIIKDLIECTTAIAEYASVAKPGIKGL